MEIIGGEAYKHKKEDCPIVLSMALRKRYPKISKLGCMLEDHVLMQKLTTGLKKYNLKLNQIHHSNKNYIHKKQLTKLLTHLLQNKKDGFFVLEHNNPKETRHLLAFLYNDNAETLDFFDSYNDTRTFYTFRLDKQNIDQFIKDMFNKYFKDEFIIEKLFEFNEIN